MPNVIVRDSGVTRVKGPGFSEPGPQGPPGEVSQAQLDAQLIATKTAVSVEEYGTLGDGSAIQLAVDDVLGTANPATTTRVAQAAIYLPAAVWEITAAPLIRSCLGLHFFGAGQSATQIRVANGSALDTAFDLDGVAYSTFEGFKVSGTGTATADKGIHLRWSTSANRSTTRNAFRDVFVGNLKYRIGFAVEQNDGDRQNDECAYDNVTCAGSWTAGETSWWQYGFKFGNATAGNTLNHHLVKPNALGNARGIAWEGSSGSVYGGGMQFNDVDFYSSAHRNIHISGGFRSEGANRLFESYGYSGAEGVVALDNIWWSANSMHADQDFILHKTAGLLDIRNLIVTSASADPHINVGNLGGLIVNVDGMVCRTAPNSLLSTPSTPDCHWTVRNYEQTNASDTHVATFPRNALAFATVASAATITLPQGAEIVNVTGTTTVTSVTAWATDIGRQVVLKFAGILTFTDGSNLKLAGDFVTSADDTITLACDGTNWHEVARSAN